MYRNQRKDKTSGRQKMRTVKSIPKDWCRVDSAKTRKVPSSVRRDYHKLYIPLFTVLWVFRGKFEFRREAKWPQRGKSENVFFKEDFQRHEVR